MKVSLETSNNDAAQQALNDMELGEEPINAGETGVILHPSFDMTAPQKEFQGKGGAPKLKIAHGVGFGIKKGFDQGQLVLEEEIALWSPRKKDDKTDPAPLQVIILPNYSDFYMEKLTKAQRDAKKYPRVFPDVKSCVAAGLNMEWRDVQTSEGTVRKGPDAQLCMTWPLLIEQPKGVTSPLFCVSFAGKNWAPAEMFVNAMCYREVEKPFGYAVRFTHKTRGLQSAVWNLTTKVKTTKSGNAVHVLSLSASRTLSVDEEKEMIAALSA